MLNLEHSGCYQITCIPASKFTESNLCLRFRWKIWRRPLAPKVRVRLGIPILMRLKVIRLSSEQQTSSTDIRYQAHQTKVGSPEMDKILNIRCLS